MTNSEQKVINFLFHTKLGYVFICLCFLGMLNLGFNIFNVDKYYTDKYNSIYTVMVIICLLLKIRLCQEQK
jgi:hypothetical protein